MRLVHLHNSKIYIARKVPTTGNRLVYTTTTSEMAHVQPTGEASSEIVEGVFGKQFKLFFDGAADVCPGDRLRNENTGEYYTVISDGVTRRSMGSIDYLLVVVQKTIG